MTARAVDDADVPIRQTYFALCFGFNIGLFTQFSVSSDVVEDHFEVLVAEGGSRSSESKFER